MAASPRPAKGRKQIRREPGQQIVGGRDFRLADEVRHIQRQAAHQHRRIVTVGQLILFSTQTGDAWLLDPADRLAARLARDGEANRSTSRRLIPRSPSVGRGAIASTDPPSFIPITIAAE
jgi:hypothetical protein